MAGRKRPILIKHSVPSIDPGVPPNTWGLSGEGRRRCATLAARLRPYGPDVLGENLFGALPRRESGIVVQSRLLENRISSGSSGISNEPQSL